MAYQPGLVPHLVGIGCDLAACRAATNLGPELKIGAGAATPEQVRSLIDALRDERPLGEAQRRALVSERVSVLDFPNAVGRPGPGGGGPIGFNVQIPGLGFYFVDSVVSRDYPVLTGLLVFYVAFLVLLNLVVDILYGILDPRTRGAR